MTGKWELVTSLFGAARVLDPPTRDSFLKIACSGDDALRSAVEELLAADTPDDDVLNDFYWARLGQEVTETTLLAGQVLKDRYRIEEKLAAGGQALLYRAIDELLKRPVVIKLMRAEGLRNRHLKSRFEQEMKALARIDHPGIVGILDVGEAQDGSPFLVIQHIPGESLREALAQGPMQGPRVARILRQMGTALGAAHAAGVAHRDLKPENIMLQPQDGREIVRLIDFGIAKIDTSGREPGITTVMAAGTVRYMAPEQLEGKNSTASDIYSMALVTCEMLCGRPDPRPLPKSVGRNTRAALNSALEFKPEDRPSDIQLWCEQVAGTLSGGKRRLVGAISAALILVALTIGATAMATRWYLDASGEPVRIIEKVGAFDPATEGFQIHNDVTGTVVRDAARTNWEAWCIYAGWQGYYFHGLTTAQKRQALERGWKLTAVMKADEGELYALADFAGIGGRFDINVLLDGDKEIVQLTTQIVPEFKGLELVQTPPRAYHRYELIYDPNLKSTDLWIDGVRRLTGYVGHHQFLEARGLVFGGAAYRSDRGSGSFKSVRLEINP
jgi:tRNA A-37 threonylcarbamoyl transferase component Bud32